MKMEKLLSILKSLRLGKNEKELLDELSALDLTVGMLLSARSSRLMFKTAREFHNWRMSRKRAMSSLQRKGLVKLQKDKVKLTALGKELVEIRSILSKMQTDNPKKRINKKWDGYWNVLIFDIPVSLGFLRNLLRSVLILSDFKKVQQSVYVSPHLSEDLKKFLRRYKDFDKYLTFLRVNQKEAPGAWKDLFNLK